MVDGIGPFVRFLLGVLFWRMRNTSRTLHLLLASSMVVVNIGRCQRIGVSDDDDRDDQLDVPIEVPLLLFGVLGSRSRYWYR